MNCLALELGSLSLIYTLWERVISGCTIRVRLSCRRETSRASVVYLFMHANGMSAYQLRNSTWNGSDVYNPRRGCQAWVAGDPSNRIRQRQDSCVGGHRSPYGVFYRIKFIISTAWKNESFVQLFLAEWAYVSIRARGVEQSKFARAQLVVTRGWSSRRGGGSFVYRTSTSMLRMAESEMVCYLYSANFARIYGSRARKMTQRVRSFQLYC